MSNDLATPTGKQMAISVGSALVVGLLLVVGVVLPAEYNLDPLGTGVLLHLVYMGEDSDSPLLLESASYRVDTIAFELSPFESVEYKYGMQKDQAMVFDWEATGELVSDMHSEPAIGPPGYAESFDQHRGEQASGTYVAPFTGIHGWFWENRGAQKVSVTLHTAGFYDRAIEFRGGGEYERTDLALPN